ncbi:MAG: leucine--tRNA ligase [archaeon]
MERSESEISKTWQEERVFEAEPDSRQKFFLTFPFPYVNGAMHMGHGYTFTRLDVSARFQRLKGKNVLFPFGFHATGEPIAGVASRLKAGDEKQRQILLDSGVPEGELGKFTEPVYIVNYWKGIFKETLDAIGGSIDWRRTFVTTQLTPTFSRFIEWQYNTLRALGYVVQGTHPVIYCTRCQSPTGDHDRLYGEGASPQDFSILKFPLEDGRILTPATLRPETIFGVTSMFLNPSEKYVDVKIGKETWIVSEKSVEKLRNQRNDVGEVSPPFSPREFFGKKCRNPANGKWMIILPADFVDGSHTTGVVMSVPSHAPFDWVGEEDLKKNPSILSEYGIDPEEISSLTPVAVITVPGYGEHPSKEIVERLGISSQKDADKLQKAKEEIYRKEHHEGKMLPVSGKYAGMSVDACKEQLKKDFFAAGILDFIWEADDNVVCRCGTTCIVKILENQWFLKFSDEAWKVKVKKAISKMNFRPETYRTQFENTVDWLHDKACARRSGLGTPLPWDKSWIVETLSDSVIYMAYYTVSHIIKEEKLTPADLTDEILDYIFRNGKRPSSAGAWAERMKASFEYWYPVDLRGSGKDLVQNHLTFYIFHHVALFEEKFWPVSIAANGYVNVEGEKMSKSKGNFVTLKEALSKYGADAVRFSLVYAAEEANDPDWRRSDAESFRQKLGALVVQSAEIPEGTKNPQLDSWLDSRIAGNLERAYAAYSEIKTRTALQAIFFDSLSDLRWYQKRGGESPETLRKFYRALAIGLSPVTPFSSERIWSNLKEVGLVSTVSWPSLPVDKSTWAGEEILGRILEDCREISKIFQKEYSKIHLYVAENWKAETVKLVRESAGKSQQEVIKAAMGIPGAKAAGGSAVQLIQKLLKDPSKLPDTSIDSGKEQAILSGAASFLSAELGKPVAVELAEGSQNPKAKQALPGKPAIYFE